MDADLRRIRAVAEYQFGPGAGAALFPDEVRIVHSRNTGRIRHIHLGDTFQATFRPNDGVFTLTIAAAKRLIEQIPDLGYTVTVSEDAAEFVSQGKNVFAKHVTRAGEKIRPGDEVIITSEKQGVIGVGKALLLSEEMKVFKIGVAIKTRRGSETDA
ncbi:MAG: pseudouridine synthase [Candidatus Bathyarchaeota archaeon]|nr:pseudouridine synthase [Candidatus Bathyarchaeota archaeon]